MTYPIVEKLLLNEIKYDQVGLAFALMRNPDGPEAAAIIEELAAVVELFADKDEVSCGRGVYQIITNHDELKRAREALRKLKGE